MNFYDPIEIIKVPIVLYDSISDFEIFDKQKKFKEYCNIIKEHSQYLMNIAHMIPPSVFFVMENGDVFLLAIDVYLQSNRKDLIQQIVKAAIKDKHDPSVYGVLMVTEAIIATSNNITEKENILKQINEGKKVSDLENKQECILIHAQTKENVFMINIPYIKIDSDMTILGEPITDEMSHVEGIYNFFSKEK